MLSLSLDDGARPTPRRKNGPPVLTMRTAALLEEARKAVGDITPEYMTAFRTTLDLNPMPRMKPRPATAAASFSAPATPRPASQPVALVRGRPPSFVWPPDTAPVAQRPCSSPQLSPSKRGARPRPCSSPLGFRAAPAESPTLPGEGLSSPGGGSPRGNPRSPSRSPRLKSHARWRRQRYSRWAAGDGPPRANGPNAEVIFEPRLRDGPRPWAKWPFVPVEAPVESARDGVKPGQLGVPTAMRIDHAAIKLTWDAAPAAECVHGYEIEVMDIDALTGAKAWRRVYRGPLTEASADFAKGVAGVRARVRAYNSHGKGEWSPISFMMRRPPPPRLDRVEIDEIPGTWLSVDLAGVPELDERNDPTFLSTTKEELLQALYKARTVIKIAFRYYALAGVANVDDDPNTMTMVQFGNFCRGSDLIGPSLSTSDVDRLFLRAVRTIPPGQSGAAAVSSEAVSAPNLLSAAHTTTLKVSKEWRKVKAAVGVSSLLGAVAAKGAQQMSQPQFVAALVRLAAHKYPEQEFSLGDKLLRLCSTHVTPHVFDELHLIDDDFSTRMRGHLMEAVLQLHHRSLRQVFAAYSAADQSSTATRSALGTMNIKECHELLEDTAVLDRTFNVRDLLIAFVKVNIDDDVYVQDDPDNSPSELVFDEFEEFLARVFRQAVWLPSQAGIGNAASMLDQDGDGDLDDDDIDDLFVECDVDGSGSITFEELKGALTKRLNAAAAANIAERLVALADEDGSGSMEKEELRKAIRRIQAGEGGPSTPAKPGALERAYEAWLKTIFVPAALKAISKKRMMQGVAVVAA